MTTNQLRVSITEFAGDQAEMTRLAEMHRDNALWEMDNGQNSYRKVLGSRDDLLDLYEAYARPGNFWVARLPETDTIVGFVGLKYIGNRAAEVKRLVVDTDYHGMGVATQLMNRLMEWVLESDIRELHLSTGVDENAIGIYKKCGFRVDHVDVAMQDNVMSCDVASYRQSLTLANGPLQILEL